MKKIRFLLLITIFSLITCITIFNPIIKAETSTRLAKGKEFFLTGRTTFYNAEAEIEQAINYLQQSKEQFSQVNNKFKQYYWLAQAEFVLGGIYEQKDNKRKAAVSFSTSEKLVRKALQINNKSSDAHRLLADTYLRQMNYKGRLYTMTHGSKALKLLKKALNIDEHNYTALNSLGSYYFNAPEIGGGSNEKAIQVLQQAFKSNNKFDNFISYVWLSKVYKEEQQPTKALNYIKQALEIYPDSPWAKEILNTIKQR